MNTDDFDLELQLATSMRDGAKDSLYWCDKERGLDEDAGTDNIFTKGGCSAAAVIRDPGIANIVDGRACSGDIIHKGNPLLTRSMGGEFVPQPNGLGGAA